MRIRKAEGAAGSRTPWASTPARAVEDFLRDAGALPSEGSTLLASCGGRDPVRRGRKAKLPKIADVSPWPGVETEAWIEIPGATTAEAPLPASPLPELVAAILAFARDAAAGTAADSAFAVLDVRIAVDTQGRAQVDAAELSVQAAGPSTGRRKARAWLGRIDLDAAEALVLAKSLVSSSPGWFDRVRRIVLTTGIPYSAAA